MIYFKDINTIEDLKAQYFNLAKKYHSDITGGDDEIMKIINAEYANLHKKYKNVHKSQNAEQETYTSKEDTKECPEDFINIVNEIFKMGLNVELCGRWLWISGDTRPHKDKLKALGCRWASKKKMWSWHYPEDSTRKHKKGGSDMSEIRNKYGSVSFGPNESNLLN